MTTDVQTVWCDLIDLSDGANCEEGREDGVSLGEYRNIVYTQRQKSDRLLRQTGISPNPTSVIKTNGNYWLSKLGHSIHNSEYTQRHTHIHTFKKWSRFSVSRILQQKCMTVFSRYNCFVLHLTVFPNRLSRSGRAISVHQACIHTHGVRRLIKIVGNSNNRSKKKPWGTPRLTVANTNKTPCIRVFWVHPLVRHLLNLLTRLN